MKPNKKIEYNYFYAKELIRKIKLAETEKQYLTLKEEMRNDLFPLSRKNLSLTLPLSDEFFRTENLTLLFKFVSGIFTHIKIDANTHAMFRETQIPTRPYKLNQAIKALQAAPKDSGFHLIIERSGMKLKELIDLISAIPAIHSLTIDSSNFYHKLTPKATRQLAYNLKNKLSNLVNLKITGENIDNMGQIVIDHLEKTPSLESFDLQFKQSIYYYSENYLSAEALIQHFQKTQKHPAGIRFTFPDKEEEAPILKAQKECIVRLYNKELATTLALIFNSINGLRDPGVIIAEYAMKTLEEHCKTDEMIKYAMQKLKEPCNTDNMTKMITNQFNGLKLESRIKPLETVEKKQEINRKLDEEIWPRLNRANYK